MQTLTKLSRLLILVCGCCLLWGCSTTPAPAPADTPPDAVEKALHDFRQRPELQGYFEQARAIVILPRNLRAGTGFGGALGKGWIIEDGEVTADVWHWQFIAGVDLGLQLYQQILFLKDQSALDEFRQQTFQFGGQANGTLLLWGRGYNPSYNEGVALFTLINGGLMLEASVGLHSYHIFPY